VSGWRHHASGVVFGVASVAIVTGAVYALRPVAPVLSLGVLYLLAVLTVAVVWGVVYALAVSVASLLVFNFLFLPPLHTFALRDSQNWVALAVYLVTAIVAGQLAARARRRAAEAEQREREAALLAEVSGLLLESDNVQAQLREIAARLAAVLGSSHAWIELGSIRRAEPGQSAHDLEAGGRHVGRLFLDAGVELGDGSRRRLLPALASLLAAASERERLRRRALEAEALRRSDAIKTAVLQAVSHDLRSPLTAIRAAIEGLESGSLTLSEADRAELLATIGIETRRLDRLVANLLDLSRLEAGAARPRPELWTLDSLVGRALEHLEGGEASRVTVALPADLPPIRIDAAQVERALANLLENALKFSPGAVELEVATSDQEVALRVVDHGPGLDPDELERVFEAFERGSVGAGRQGSGLGLAIARGFVTANGGRLWAEAGADGGAVFVLALPAAEALATVGA
jgi:two-component system, OmpR family, sensor histidine kinase KdpD